MSNFIMQRVSRHGFFVGLIASGAFVVVTASAAITNYTRARAQCTAHGIHCGYRAGGFPGAGYLVLGAPRTFVVSGTVGF
jgi:hypothetical protein